MTLDRKQLLEMSHEEIRAFFDGPDESERGSTQVIRAPPSAPDPVETWSDAYLGPSFRPISFKVIMNADGTVSTVVEQGDCDE